MMTDLPDVAACVREADAKFRDWIKARITDNTTRGFAAKREGNYYLSSHYFEIALSYVEMLDDWEEGVKRGVA